MRENLWSIINCPMSSKSSNHLSKTCNWTAKSTSSSPVSSSSDQSDESLLSLKNGWDTYWWESMLDSVIRARDRWMKPTGAMFPSHATMFWSAVSFEEDRCGKKNEYNSAMDDWRMFSQEMNSLYDVNVDVLTEQYEKEQSDYYIYSSLWTELQPEHVIGQPAVIKRLDLNTCTLADSEVLKKIPFEITVPFPIRVSGFAGWFTVDFNGSAGSPVTKRVQLSTAPDAGYTHWGQQVF